MHSNAYVEKKSTVYKKQCFYVSLSQLYVNRFDLEIRCRQPVFVKLPVIIIFPEFFDLPLIIQVFPQPFNSCIYTYLFLLKFF